MSNKTTKAKDNEVQDEGQDVQKSTSALFKSNRWGIGHKLGSTLKHPKKKGK